MRFPRKEIVEAVRARYPKGTRVELVFMDDPYSRLKPGDPGDGGICGRHSHGSCKMGLRFRAGRGLWCGPKSASWKAVILNERDLP